MVFSVVKWVELTGLDLYHPYCDGLFWYNKVELTREGEEAGVQERYELSVSGIPSVALRRVVQPRVDETQNTRCPFQVSTHKPFSTTPITPSHGASHPPLASPFLYLCSRNILPNNSSSSSPITHNHTSTGSWPSFSRRRAIPSPRSTARATRQASSPASLPSSKSSSG